MIHKPQPRWESDSNFVAQVLRDADSHNDTVQAVFRGGLSMTIEPGKRLDELEKRYRKLFGFPEPDGYGPRWRSPSEAWSDEQAAMKETAA